MHPHSPVAAPAGHLPRLVNLRWLEVGSQLAVLGIARYVLDMSLPWQPMLAVCLALGIGNLLTVMRLKGPWPVTDLELFAQLSTDVLALATLLYFSGGSANPFVSLLLLPLTIAATTLGARHAWAMGAIVVAAYTLLMFHSQPLPEPRASLPVWLGGESPVPAEEACHVEPLPAAGHESHVMAATPAPAAMPTTGHEGHAGHDMAGGSGFALHLLGMWFNFVVSGLVVAFFLTRMAAALRARERELALAREAALRHEQILALGTLAAGAAHQLGTPLSTLAVVLREMELEHGPNNADLAADLALARQQVAHCKTTLSRILADAGHHRGEGGEALALDAFLNAMLDDWRLLRPDARLAVSLDGPRPAPAILKEPSLEHALLNLLDNAADASPAGVELQASWNADQCVLEILDRGPGFDAAARSGQPFISTKAGGLGIGLFLSNATLERFGGKVELFDREGGGTRTRVTLPLCRIQDPGFGIQQKSGPP